MKIIRLRKKRCEAQEKARSIRRKRLAGMAYWYKVLGEYPKPGKIYKLTREQHQKMIAMPWVI